MTLQEGDYSVALNGEILPIRIERKSHSDLCAVVGFERDRFERELERLRSYRADLIIEASLDDILHGYERSSIPGRTVAASLASWSVDFGIHVWFAENHRRAAGWTQRILEEFAQYTWLKRQGTA